MNAIMETSPKRKKRKTRKCLDDLRKRSRRNVKNSTNTPQLAQVKKIKYLDDNPNQIFITASRLSLSMFPKVIRSETVTRPTHPEIKNITKNVSDVRNLASKSFGQSQSCSSDSDSNKSIENEWNVRLSNDRSYPIIDHGVLEHLSSQRNSDSVSSQNNSPGSLVLFSPLERSEDSDVLELTASESSSSPLSHSSRGDYGYHRYEEFMNDIPVYLKQHSPALVKEDVMAKTKAFLHNIYIEGCQKECENNILHCMNENKNKLPHRPAVQSPPGCLTLSQAPRRHLQTVAELHALNNTPDYTYYPHKLNN